MSRTTALVAVLLSTLLVGSCARDDGPETAPATKGAASSRPPESPPPEKGHDTVGETAKPATGRPTTKEPAPQPPAPDPFDEALAEVRALEQDARIFDAMKRCRDMRRRFKGHARAPSLDAVASRLRAEKRTVAAMAGVVEKLTSPRAEVAEVARGQVREAGAIGRILLRKALRERSDEVAVAAARLLVELRDNGAPLAFSAKLAQHPPEPLRAVLCKGLAALAGLADQEVCSALWPAVRDDAALENWDVAGVLCAVLATRCGGDPKQFGELAKDDQAYARLSAYVRRALGAEDAAAAAWARSAALAIGCAEQGLRGSYFEGLNFEKLVVERLDTAIDLTHKDLPFPDGRTENVSVRWTGFLRVKRRGTFMFSVVSDDGERLWVNGLPLLNDWTMHLAAENLASVELAKGFHPIRFEYMNGEGEGRVKLSWSGPGFGMRPVTGEDLRTLPWKGLLKGKAPN